MNRCRKIARAATALVCITMFSATAIASNAKAVDEDELGCLAVTIYHEARGEPREGQVAVAHVILNRRGRGEFPATICGVVKQGAEKGDGTCQFSIWCDGRAEQQNTNELDESRAIAQAVIAGDEGDPTDGAQWFHAVDAAPPWAQSLTPTVRIGNHQFLRPRRERATAR